MENKTEKKVNSSVTQVAASEKEAAESEIVEVEMRGDVNEVTNSDVSNADDETPSLSKPTVIDSTIEQVPANKEKVEVAEPPTMRASDAINITKGNDPEKVNGKKTNAVLNRKTTKSTNVVAADTVQAEEVPTIPLSSLQTLNALQPEVSIHSVASTRTVRVPTPLVAHSAEYKRSSREWLQLLWEGMRPSYIALPLLPVLMGSLLGWMQSVNSVNVFGRFNIVTFLGSILTLFLLQIGANLINDYYDYVRGTDTSNALGPGGLIQQGLMSPSRVLLLGLVSLGIAAVLGVAVSIIGGGPLVLLLGLVVVVAAFFFSATKYALTSFYLGEIVSFILYGPLLTIGAYWLQRGTDLQRPLLYSLLPGLFAFAIIHANNMRDIEGDMQSGRRTIAGLIGLTWSRLLYIVLVLAAYLIITALGVPSGAPHLILIAWWTLPLLVVALSGAFRCHTPAAAHILMRQTLKMEVYFIILVLVALLILALFPVLPAIPLRLIPA